MYILEDRQVKITNNIAERHMKTNLPCWPLLQMPPFFLSFQPSKVLRGRVLGPEPPPPRRRTKCPPVTSGPGHGAVHPRANGRHNELRGLGPSSHPSAHRGQPGSNEAASLPRRGQAARASTYEPMTRRASLGEFISWLFCFVLFFFVDIF